MTKVIFMGTPEIGKYVLQSLLDLQDVQVIAVVCQPDRLMNRKKEIIYQPVKQLALEHNIPVLQPNKVKEITEEIAQLQPDVIVTCAFGQFINKEILAIPTYGCFNVHASLLPKLRGGAPIHWAIINGETESGMTLMKMVSKMDAGDIISQMKCPISARETTASLYDKLKQLGYDIIQRDFHLLLQQDIPSVAQYEALVTFGYNITKEQEIVDFNNEAHVVDQWIRGLFSKPMANFNYQGELIKIHAAEMTSIPSKVAPGEISQITKEAIYIATKNFDIALTKIQLPNKKPLLIKELLNGNNVFTEWYRNHK
ncbi:methionyl-tRNA formyltransferase [Ureaplasma ceti]|uniref:Methionyl-tRNA formyltransferase n=1 Tax=Ureaplasma ceti TaxID=3119530 RepID=A0ABP9U4M2_9BACT